MKTKTLTPVINFLIAVSASLNFFWILNIIKTAAPATKGWLTLYAPVGPLSGLFIYSLLFGLAVFAILSRVIRIVNQAGERRAFVIYYSSIVLFFLMVFPPIFEAVAKLFE